MLLNMYLTLIGVTAFLLSLVGIWVVSAVSKSDRTRRWVLFLLVAAGHPPATSWMFDLELELMKDTGGL